MPLRITLRDPKLVQRLRSLAHHNQISPAAYAVQIIELWLQEHRSQRFVPDPKRHEASNPSPWLSAV
jgi:hypothetical protein